MSVLLLLNCLMSVKKLSISEILFCFVFFYFLAVLTYTFFKLCSSSFLLPAVQFRII